MKRTLLFLLISASAFAQAPRPPIDKLSQLRDVTVTGVNDAQVLGYDSALGKWKPLDAVGGSSLLDNTNLNGAWDTTTTKAPTDHAVFQAFHRWDQDDDGNIDHLGLLGGIVRTNGTGAISAAVAGTDYMTPSGVAAVYAPLDNPIFTTRVTLNSAQLLIQGNLSAPAWTTNGVRIKGIPGTLTDTTSSGSVGVAYTSTLGANTIAANNATTYVDYFGMYMKDPVAGSNVTMNRKWGFGGDSARIGTSNQVSINNTGHMTVEGVTSTGATGTGKFVFDTGSTPTSMTLTNATGLPLTTGVTGNLPAANFPALTGEVTNSAGSLATTVGAMTHDFDVGTHKVTNVVDPTTAQQAATKNYVDSSLSAFQPLEAVYAASTANIAGTYANGASGIGATFTVTATGALSIDGASPPANSRVLLKDQSTGFQNGVYDVTVVGSVGVSPVLTRSLDFNTAGEMNAGDLIPVINGTVNTTTSWLQTATIVTVGTTALVFTQYSKAPSSYQTHTTNLDTWSGIAPGTGVGTALAINVGTSGAFVTNGGALGTPSGGTATNITGLPISTGVSGLATGVATFLGTSSSANLASALTDETGSGKSVFDTGPVFAAGSASAGTKPKLTSGTVMTAPEAGALEYDGAGFYATGNTTSGREAWETVAQYMMTADGSVSNTASITDMFPATSSFPTVTNGIYEIIFDVFFLKTTAGTMTFTVTNTQTYTNLVGLFQLSNASGIATAGTLPGAGLAATTTAAAAFPATASLTTAVNHYVHIRVLAECGTAGNIRLRGTPSAGTFTTLRGSAYTVRRWTGNVGAFVN